MWREENLQTLLVGTSTGETAWENNMEFEKQKQKQTYKQNYTIQQPSSEYLYLS